MMATKPKPWKTWNLKIFEKKLKKPKFFTVSSSGFPKFFFKLPLSKFQYDFSKFVNLKINLCILLSTLLLKGYILEFLKKTHSNFQTFLITL